MLGVNWVELFLRGIPEMFLVIWGIYIIAGKSLDVKKCVPLSIIISIVIFFIRKLPIYFGVHTMIMIILIIGIMVIIGIPIITSIYGTLSMLLVLSLSEFINMLILRLLLGVDVDLNLMAPVKKSLLGIPSLVISFLLVLLLQYLLKKRGSKNVSN